LALAWPLLCVAPILEATMPRRSWLLVLCLGVLCRTAEAKTFRFVGAHPLGGDPGGGYCYIGFPHVHAFAPVKAELLYRVHDDAYFFVGDPVPFGYDGPRHAFMGVHPVHLEVRVGEADITEYCYLEGPHYHAFVPASDAKFVAKGGVYWYVGELPSEVREKRPKLSRINAVYRPLVYARPVVVVAPPPGFHAEVAVSLPPAPVVHAHVGVEVHVPVPTLELHVGAVATERPRVVHVDEHEDEHEHDDDCDHEKHRRRGHAYGRGKHKGKGRW
jgi:hypothetical protein